MTKRENGDSRYERRELNWTKGRCVKERVNKDEIQPDLHHCNDPRQYRITNETSMIGKVGKYRLQ